MGSWHMLVAVGMLGVGVSAAEAQTRTVSGRVIDARTQRPISAGSVSIKGAAIRDHLRPDGVFVLHVPLRDVTLIIQSDGYRRHTVTVTASEETAFVSLVPDLVTVEGVVVVGSTADRANRATSTTTLRARDIDKVPAASITQALQGKVAGADIQNNSGVPGGDLQLTLRGVTTLSGATSPLYVVDGVIVSNTAIASGAATVTGGQESRPGRVSDLNPNDIERIEILKGAAASAMYGSRGANGVVIITTRRR